MTITLDSNNERVVRAVGELSDVIKQLNDGTTKQNDEMIRLTRSIHLLTWVMVAVGIIQVFLVIVQLRNP